MKISHRSGNKGFTLVEMMVVIAIIAILTGIIITGLVGSKAKSRDAKRASDLSQIQLAVEQFFDRCDQYPTSLIPTAGGAGICPNNTSGIPITFGNFISVIPKDPTTNSSYDYVVNNGTTPTDYVLHTKFEAVNSVSPQSAPVPNWWTVSQSFASNPSVTGSSSCDTLLNYCVRPN